MSRRDRSSASRFSRRQFLRVSGIAGAAALAVPLASWPTTPPTYTPTAPAPASAPPSAPAPAAASPAAATNAAPAGAAGARSSAPPARSQVLTYADTAPPRSIDPHNAFEQQSMHVTRAVYEGLVKHTTGTTEIEPRL